MDPANVCSDKQHSALYNAVLPKSMHSSLFCYGRWLCFSPYSSGVFHVCWDSYSVCTVTQGVCACVLRGGVKIHHMNQMHRHEMKNKRIKHYLWIKLPYKLWVKYTHIVHYRAIFLTVCYSENIKTDMVYLFSWRIEATPIIKQKNVSYLHLNKGKITI